MKCLSELHLEDDVATITAGLDDILQSSEFVQYVTEQVTEDVLIQLLSKFRIEIINDGDSVAGNKYQADLSISKFRSIVHTSEDLLQQFIHNCMHDILWEFWKNCPVSVSELGEDVFDVFDDMLIQAYIYDTMPHLHNLHVDYVHKVASFVDKNITAVDEVVRLYQPPLTTTHELSKMHEWIYKQEDVLTQKTFNAFMVGCRQALRNADVRLALTNYGEAL